MSIVSLTIDNAYAHCEALTRRRESNFALGFEFLPADKKRAIFVVYAFCRYVDDISDENQGGDVPRLLQQWRDEIRGIYEEGKSEHPIGIALLDVLRRYSIPAEGFRELILGCEQDQRVDHYAAFGDLAGYCELVATSIAKVSVPVYGCKDAKAASPMSRSLSFAFQLTNILRDVREDLGRGRLYLPEEDLRRFGLTEEDLARGQHPERIAELYRFEGQRCERYFQEGTRVLQYLHSDSHACVRAMGMAYHILLGKIMKDPMRALESQVILSQQDREKVRHEAHPLS